MPATTQHAQPFSGFLIVGLICGTIGGLWCAEEYSSRFDFRWYEYVHIDRSVVYYLAGGPIFGLAFGLLLDFTTQKWRWRATILDVLICLLIVILFCSMFWPPIQRVRE